MAIGFVVAVEQAGNSLTPSVGRTGGADASRLNRVVLHFIAYTGAITVVPTGDTLIDTQAIGNGWSLGTYWRLHLGTSEPASFAWTSDTSGRWATTAAEWTGVNTTTPVDVKSKQPGASSTSVVAPGVDPNFLEDMLVWAGAVANTSTWTEPSGFAEIHDTPAAALISLGTAYLLLASGAATGDITGTASSAGVWAAQLIALRDASATSDSTDATGTISVGNATADGTGVTGTPSNVNATGTVSIGSATADGVRTLARDSKRAFGPLVYSRTAGVVGRKVG